MRCHHRRKEKRSAAYFFAGPGLGRDFAFGVGTLSAGLVFMTVCGFGVDCFVLVFFGMISSWGASARQPIAGIGYVDRGAAYKATAVTAMQVIARAKNGRKAAGLSRLPVDEPNTIGFQVDSCEPAMMNIDATEPFGSVASLPFGFFDRGQ